MRPFTVFCLHSILLQNPDLLANKKKITKIFWQWPWKPLIFAVFLLSKDSGTKSMIFYRAGKLLIGYPSESLVFCPKMSNSLMIAHFLWATWANRSWLLIFVERPERFAHIANFLWAAWAIRSHRSLKRGNERIVHFLNKKKRL